MGIYIVMIASMVKTMIQVCAFLCLYVRLNILSACMMSLSLLPAFYLCAFVSIAIRTFFRSAGWSTDGMID